MNYRPYNHPKFAGAAGAFSGSEDRTFEIPTFLPRADSFSILSMPAQLRVSRKDFFYALRHKC